MTFLAAVGAVLGAAGSAFSAISQYQAAKFQQKVAKANAKIADQNARRAINDSQVAEQRQDQMTAAALGEQTAVQAASGLSLEEGSPLSIRQSTARLGRLDTLTLRNNAERTAHNYKVDAMNSRAQADIAGMTAQNSLVAGFINTAGSLVGSANSNAQKWDPWKQQKSLVV